MAQIQWFPGHMAKAKREIAEKIKLIDIVVELVDARAPYSSKNPLFNGIVNNKPRLIVMTKEDLANPEITKKWIQYYKDHGYYAMSVNLKQFNEYKKIIDESNIKIYMVGGDGSGIAESVEGFAAFKKYIIDGGYYSPEVPGVPIAFTASYLMDNSPVYTKFKINIPN